MNIREYLKVHTIIEIGNLISDEYLCSETIVDCPEEFVKIVSKSEYIITEITWWDRVSILNSSDIGYGGPLDPRAPKEYYFAETDLRKRFIKATKEEYLFYIKEVKDKYSKYDIYPAFEVALKISNH